MGTPLVLKCIPYTYMDPLGRGSVGVVYGFMLTQPVMGSGFGQDET